MDNSYLNYNMSPNVWTDSPGGGWLSLFGLPFFLAGLFMLLTFFEVIDIGEVTGDRNAMLIVGSIFTLVGTLLVFGRLKVTIDNGSKKILKTFSIIIPVKKFEYNLTDFNLVEITKEIRRSDKSTTIVYPVNLKGNDENNLNIKETRDYNKSRLIAEQIAKIIGFNIEDSSTGTAVLRENEHLDESLRERKKRTGITVEIPNMPQSLFERITDRGSYLEISLPKNKGLMIRILIPLLSMIAFYGIAFSFFAGNFDDYTKDFDKTPIYFIIIFCLIFFLPIIFIIAGAIFMNITPTLVKVSPISLNVFSGRKEIEISCDDLEELVTEGMDKKNNFNSFFSANSITAISDKVNISFGQGLTSEELIYVYAVIFNKVTE